MIIFWDPLICSLNSSVVWCCYLKRSLPAWAGWKKGMRASFCSKGLVKYINKNWKSLERLFFGIFGFTTVLFGAANFTFHFHFKLNMNMHMYISFCTEENFVPVFTNEINRWRYTEGLNESQFRNLDVYDFTVLYMQLDTFVFNLLYRHRLGVIGLHVNFPFCSQHSCFFYFSLVHWMLMR